MIAALQVSADAAVDPTDARNLGCHFQSQGNRPRQGDFVES
jgi:hypothetical protein